MRPATAPTRRNRKRSEDRPKVKPGMDFQAPSFQIPPVPAPCRDPGPLLPDRTFPPLETRVARVALVTGGGVRIGRALCLGLADAGFHVVVHYHSSEAAARETADGVRAAGRRAVLAPGDVAIAAEVEEVAATVRREFGRLDLLVNNASIFRAVPLARVDEPEWDRVMAVNLKGPFLMVRALAGLLAECRGNVVNLVDLSAFQPWVQYPHHSVSKAALLQLTRVQARSLAPHIRVNAVAPGAVLPPESDGEEEREKARRRAALGTLGSPDDVVRTVLFLDRSPYITGEVVVVDGGAHLTGR